MVTLRDIANTLGTKGKKKMVWVEGSLLCIDYKDLNGQIQLIASDPNEVELPEEEHVTVGELLEVFQDEAFRGLPIADEDGRLFESAAATENRLEFRYE